MSSHQTDPLNASIKNAAFECLKNYNPKLEQNLNKDEYTALKSLINDKDIIIQKSDISGAYKWQKSTKQFKCGSLFEN